MPALSVFKLPKAGLKITFDPDDHFLSLFPKTKQNKHVFDDILNHLQTVLQTFDLKSSPSSTTMKVGDNVDLSVIQGVLRSKGFTGGEALDDAASMVQSNEEDNAQPQATPIQPNEPNPQEQQPQMEAKFSLMEILFESTYRTAPYWNDLFAYSGKSNKSAVMPEDILRMRKVFTKKPKSKTRDKVLRALDKASRYFTKKVRKMSGDAAAQDFKMKYKNIGSLVPSDYADEMGQEEPEANPVEQPEMEQPDLNLSDFFNQQGENYDDIEIERV